MVAEQARAAAGAPEANPPQAPREDGGRDGVVEQGQEREGVATPEGAVGDEGVVTPPTTDTPEIPPAIVPPQRNLGDIAWTFLTTFFTSLIPETYQNN